MAKKRRTPHGVRGLKLGLRTEQTRPQSSHPSRGAWIEMRYMSRVTCFESSHPSRGAWIEIYSSLFNVIVPESVAPLTGCVD